MPKKRPTFLYTERGVVVGNTKQSQIYDEIIVRVEDYFLRKLKSIKKETHQIDKIGRLLLHNPNPFSLDWLADQACLCQRQFYRQFVEREGISPKMYARIARFEKAMKLKNANPTKDWFTIAVDLGYYDYRHLVRDFKEFTNLAPNAFLQYENQAPERTFGKVET